MSNGQAILLYLAIIPLICFLVLATINYIYCKIKRLKQAIRNVHRQIKTKQEEIEKYKYIKSCETARTVTQR